MATWIDLVGYVRNNYRISQEDGDLITLIFEFDDLRTQLVFLRPARLFGGAEEWALIESPFAPVSQVDPKQVLNEVGSIVCGGLSRVGDMLTIRHAIPLINQNINEFERPLALVTNTADDLEKRFLGTDTF